MQIYLSSCVTGITCRFTLCHTRESRTQNDIAFPSKLSWNNWYHATERLKIYIDQGIMIMSRHRSIYNFLFLCSTWIKTPGLEGLANIASSLNFCSANGYTLLQRRRAKCWMGNRLGNKLDQQLKITRFQQSVSISKNFYCLYLVINHETFGQQKPL